MWPYLIFEDKVLKAVMRKKFDKTKPYFYFGFHLPSESTVALRALPFMTQVFLVESISRVLPKGYHLYVREHPSWKTHFPYSRLKHLRKLPNVRLISTRIPINEILKHSKGLVTYNATTGIEALMYGKPVLAFAANVYSGLHSGASLCLDLYEAGERLARLPETKVDKNETYRYIYKLMRASTEMTLAAGTFLSVEDSAKKSKIFTKALIAAAEYCRDHKADPKT
jgi:CDP-glycerol glycerophosphotransferase (TagB/SpsB family)